MNLCCWPGCRRPRAAWRDDCGIPHIIGVDKPYELRRGVPNQPDLDEGLGDPTEVPGSRHETDASDSRPSDG